MRQNDLQARRKRSYKVTTQSKHKLPVAPNLLAQNFTTNAPNQKWLADITYIATSEGWMPSPGQAGRGISPLFSTSIRGGSHSAAPAQYIRDWVHIPTQFARYWAASVLAGRSTNV